MPAPAGMSQTVDGGWVHQDGSGPYALDCGGPAEYNQDENGFWFKEDGSGPYVNEGLGVFTLATSIWRA